MAGPIEPPLELLYSSSNVLIAAKLIRIDPDGRIELQRSRTLSGATSPADRIVVRVDPKEAGRLKTGSRYVAGYSIYMGNPRDREHRIANPGGPVLIRSPGLEPAIFADTRLLRAILREGREHEEKREADHDGEERGREPRSGHDEKESERESMELPGLLLKALKGSDTQLQNLAANQLAYDPEIGASLDAGDRAILKRVASDAKKLPAARSALLQAAFHDADRFGDWWSTVAQDIVTTTPIGGYSNETEGLDGLVMAAFSVLGAGKINPAPDSLVRWVGGENPALSERALVMLRKQSPGAERSAVRHALESRDLPVRTRKFLEDHLRRLDLMQKRQERDHGDGHPSSGALHLR